MLPRSILFLSLLTLSSPALAKDKAASRPALPGDIGRTADANVIFFEQGRYLLWSSGGTLTLKGGDNAVLAQVDLKQKAKKESGEQAMGIEVEEADLGGSQGGKYLSGKRKPQGKSFNEGALAGKPQETEAGTTSKVMAGSVPLTITAYPTGAAIWKWEWPGMSEEVYFDRRKTMVYNQQSQQKGPWQYSLRQYADGSFVRSYKTSGGSLDYTFDTNDKSYNLTFMNAQGEALAEISCLKEGCPGS